MLNKIGKLYDNIRRGVAPKKEEPDIKKRTVMESKKFQELYGDIISEAKISVKFNDDPDVKHINLPDEYAKKVLGFANTMAENAEQVVKDWVIAGGWGDVAQKVIVPSLLKIFQEHYDLDNIQNTKNIIVAIKTLIDNKDRLQSFHKALVSDSNDFYSFINYTHNDLDSTRIFDKGFADKVKNIVFTESGVAVGEGEVLITLLSEATNPDKGDLEIEGVGEVELKGSGGRAGKGDVIKASAKALDNIGRILADTTASVKNETMQEMFVLASQLQPYSQQINQSKPRYKGQVLYLDIIKALMNNQNVERLIKDLTPAVARKVFSKGAEFILINNPTIDTHTYSRINTELEKRVNYYNNIKMKGNAVNFGTYFNIHEGEPEAVDMMASFSFKDKESIKPAIANYADKLSPAQIVASIQIAGYQQSEKFKFIVYFNSKTNRMVSIGPFTNNYVENLERVLQKAHNFTSVSTNLGGGAGRGGFNVTV